MIAFVLRRVGASVVTLLLLNAAVVWVVAARLYHREQLATSS